MHTRRADARTRYGVRPYEGAPREDEDDASPAAAAKGLVVGVLTTAGLVAWKVQSLSLSGDRITLPEVVAYSAVGMVVGVFVKLLSR